MFAAKFLHDTEAVWIAVRFLALKNCCIVRRLLVAGVAREGVVDAAGHQKFQLQGEWVGVARTAGH